MVKKIITHLPPRHLDDTLAVALLCQKYKSAEIVFKDNVTQEELESPEVVVVDVGGDYNPAKKNYDHHQHQDVPCSFVLVLAHEFPEYAEVFHADERLKKALNFIDVKDRKGFAAAVRETGENPSSTAFFLETALLSAADEHGIRVLGKGLKSFLDRILEEREKMKNVLVVRDKGMTVVYDPYGLKAGELFKEYDADLIIQKNPRNENHTSIIKNTSKENAENIDLSKVFNSYEKVFLHNTGFIAVVNESIENVLPQQVLKCLIGKDIPIPDFTNENENIETDREP